ncbi:hypothetical protein [Rickettsia fournieri]|uniref:hypothetical protein n=1 Tax=Rickettsia fournieri TaxID=1436798 RepID=UPI000CDECA68|nr:hypothetical protein [Rickettsia fournieri]
MRKYSRRLKQGRCIDFNYNITENSAILSDIGYKFPQEILNLILNAIAPEDIINIIKHANLENISYDVLESQMGGEDFGINNSL